MNTPQIDVPDLDEQLDLIEKIKEVSLAKSMLELSLKDKEAQVVVAMTSEEKYFVNGKKPAMNFIKSTAAFTGINGELIPLRKKLAELEIELEFLKNSFYIYKDMVHVWRTLSANQRAISE